jgi:hypothetical protein
MYKTKRVKYVNHLTSHQVQITKLSSDNQLEQKGREGSKKFPLLGIFLHFLAEIFRSGKFSYFFYYIIF